MEEEKIRSGHPSVDGRAGVYVKISKYSTVLYTPRVTLAQNAAPNRRFKIAIALNQLQL